MRFIACLLAATCLAATPLHAEGVGVNSSPAQNAAKPLDFERVFASPGLKLCEWPDNAAGVMPTPDLELNIQVDDHEQRQVQLTALTPRGQELLA